MKVSSGPRAAHPRRVIGWDSPIEYMQESVVKSDVGGGDVCRGSDSRIDSEPTRRRLLTGAPESTGENDVCLALEVGKGFTEKGRVRQRSSLPVEIRASQGEREDVIRN